MPIQMYEMTFPATVNPLLAISLNVNQILHQVSEFAR